MRVATLCFLALPLTAACGATVVSVELPREDGMKSILIGAEFGDQFSMHGYDLASLDPEQIPVLDPFPGEANLYALYYDRPLLELDLPAGRIERAEAGELVVPLPEFDAAYQTSATRDHAEAWRPIDNDPNAIAFQRKAPPETFDHCFDIAVLRKEAPALTRYRAAVMMSDSEVLGFSNDGFIVRVGPNDNIETVTSTSSYRVSAGARAPGDDVFIGDEDGQIFRGHPERGYKKIRQLPDAIRSMSNVADPTELTSELFVMTSSNSVHRFKDGVWKDIERVPTGSHPRRGEIVNFGPGAAAMLPVGGEAFVVVERDMFDIHLSDLLLLGQLAGMTRVRSGRIATLNRLGSLLEGTRNGLMFSKTYESAEGAFRLAPFGDGFVYIRKGSAVVYGELDRAQCPQKTLEMPSQAWAMAPMGERVVAFTTMTGADDGLVMQADVLIISRAP